MGSDVKGRLLLSLSIVHVLNNLSSKVMHFMTASVWLADVRGSRKKRNKLLLPLKELSFPRNMSSGI